MAKTTAVLVAALLCGMLQDEVDNTEYKNWSKFKVGAWAKYKQVSDMGSFKTEMEMTSKLVDLAKEKAVIETAMKMGGNALPAQKRDVPAKIKKADETQGVKITKGKEGDEDVEIAGKKIKCHWAESTVEAAGNKTTAKAWTSDEVPGGLVKSESQMEGQMKMTSTMTLVEYKTE